MCFKLKFSLQNLLSDHPSPNKFNPIKMRFFLVVLISVFLLSGVSQTMAQTKPAKVKAGAKADEDAGADDPQGEVIMTVKAKTKDAIFKDGDNVKFKFDLKNTFKVDQSGTLSYVVSNEFGKQVYQNSISVKVRKNDSENYDISFKQKDPDFYQISFRLNLTNYDDTTKRFFGIDPDKISSDVHKPADFDDFWGKAKFTLGKILPQYKITEQKNLSTKEKRVYLVEMHSWDNAVIRGWLTIPTNKPNKIPVKYRLPGYLVELKPTMDDDDFAVFNLNTRGSGNSKDALKFTGEFNLYHLQNADSYVYKGVYMDCLRGADFIFDNAEALGLDKRRVSVDGGSQGGALALITAGMDNRISMVTSELPLYCDLRNAIKIGPVLYPEKKSPIWMLSQYLKSRPYIKEDALYAVWDYYDPINFAPMIKCPVLMAVSLLDELCPPRCSFAMFNKLGSKRKEAWVNPILTHEVDEQYYKFQYFYIKETFIMP